MVWERQNGKPVLRWQALVHNKSQRMDKPLILHGHAVSVCSGGWSDATRRGSTAPKSTGTVAVVSGAHRPAGDAMAHAEQAVGCCSPLEMARVEVLGVAVPRAEAQPQTGNVPG